MAIATRKLENGQLVSLTVGVKGNHNHYHVYGKENYILTQVKVLEFLKKTDSQQS